MNNNVTVPSCQFSNHRWIVFVDYEFVEACNMNAFEFAVLSRIVSKVQRRIDTDTWDNGGYCSLAIQSICNTFSADRVNVQRCINVLELAGIITVQRRYGIPHTITVTPHTEWVVTNFRELRAIANKGKSKRAPISSRSPNTDAVDAHAVTDAVDTVDAITDAHDADAVDAVDNVTVPDANDADAVSSEYLHPPTDTDADAVDTVTDAVDISTNTDAHITDAVDTVTPLPNGKQAPIIKPKPNTVTDTNGYRHNPYAVNIPSPVPHSLPPDDVKAKYCNNGKRAPLPDADAATPLTLHVMDSNGNVVDTVALTTNTDAATISKGKSRKSRKGSYSPSPNQYADDDDDDDALPICNMNYAEYRESKLWNRK